MTLDELIVRLQALQPAHGGETVWVGDESAPWDFGEAEYVAALPERPAVPGMPYFPPYIAIAYRSN